MVSHLPRKIVSGDPLRIRRTLRMSNWDIISGYYYYYLILTSFPCGRCRRHGFWQQAMGAGDPACVCVTPWSSAERPRGRAHPCGSLPHQLSGELVRRTALRRSCAVSDRSAGVIRPRAAAARLCLTTLHGWLVNCPALTLY